MASLHSSLRLGALALGLLPATALAGPPEVLTGVVIHPTDSEVIILRYENVLGGLFYSGDGARSFRIRPGLTFTRSGLRADTSIAFAGDALLVGSSDGLVKTDRNGCAVSNAISRAFVDAIATDPNDPSVAYFVTSRADNAVRVGLWQRDANGAITPLGADDTASSLIVTSMQLVGTRFVQTGTRGSANLLRSSDDRGQSWRELPIPGTGTPRLLAIDAQDPLRMLVALENEKTADPVLVTRDGGASWQTYLDGVLRAGQAALAPDGRVWISDMGDRELPGLNGGLWFAARIGEPPEQVLSELGVTCLAHDRTRDQLWLCQDYELDSFDPRTRGLCREFVLSDLESFVDCGADDLSRSARAQEQLCTGYCGALHFAQAPICAFYDDPIALCGLPARRYDGDAGWADPAGPRTRCDALPVDAAVSPLVDAGLPSNAIDGGAEQERAKDDGCNLAAQGDFSGALFALLLALRKRRR
ncbi:MAG TPA: hypothetical protein VFX59_03500 [Polyangiales bacterium]|nr:hypothetical protein [Polyangiales bacterium]